VLMTFIRDPNRPKEVHPAEAQRALQEICTADDKAEGALKGVEAAHSTRRPSQPDELLARAVQVLTASEDVADKAPAQPFQPPPRTEQVTAASPAASPMNKRLSSAGLQQQQANVDKRLSQSNAPATSSSAAAAADEESEYETDSDEEGHARANPAFGLKRREETTDPWRMYFEWVVAVVNWRLNKPGVPPGFCKTLQSLLPIGPDEKLKAVHLQPEHLSDGKLLCAMCMSVEPKSIGKPNPVQLGRISQFLQVCTEKNMHNSDLFTPPDLMPAPPKNPDLVLRCLVSYTNIVHAMPTWTGPKVSALLLAGARR